METLERELAKTYAYEDAWQTSGPAKGVELKGGMRRKEVADGSLGRWTEQGRAELCACSGPPAVSQGRGIYDGPQGTSWRHVSLLLNSDLPPLLQPHSRTP